MKRLVTWLVVLALLVFLVFKAAVWWLADKRLAEARSALEEYGVLERGVIASGTDGRLLLSAGSWQDFRLTRPLDIGRVEFDTGSPVSLLTALADPSQLPPVWTLQAESLGLILEPTMFRNWVTDNPDEGEREPGLFRLSCAPDPRQQLGAGDLIRLGITGLAGEFMLRQTPQELYAELNTAGTGSLELTWPDTRLKLSDLDGVGDLPSRQVTATLRDGGLMRRIAAYCARESGLELLAWAERSLQGLRDGLAARGLVPSEGLQALYQRWLLEGGEMTADLRPGAPWLGIPVYPADSGPGQGWAVSYNGTLVTGVYLQEAPAPRKQASPAVQEQTVRQEVAGEEGWYADSVDSAGSWIGYRVRVTLSNDNVVVGRLDRVGERELEVARLVGGGEVAYPMLLRAVAGFEVWRRGREQ